MAESFYPDPGVFHKLVQLNGDVGSSSFLKIQYFHRGIGHHCGHGVKVGIVADDLRHNSAYQQSSTPITCNHCFDDRRNCDVWTSMSRTRTSFFRLSWEVARKRIQASDRCMHAKARDDIEPACKVQSDMANKMSDAID